MTAARSKTFCSLPFMAMNVHIDGGLAACCYQSHDDVTHRFRDYQTWRAVGMFDLKKNLIQGTRDPACRRCWDLEDNGVRSYRQQWNDNLATWIDQQDQWSAETVLDLRMLHLDFDNFCNLRCIMCHPQVSSSLESEYRLHKAEYQPFIGQPILPTGPWHEDQKFEELLHTIKQVDTLIVTGGEPLINPKVLRLIRALNPEQLNLIVTTNGTQIRPEVYELLRGLRSCSITVSLEGVGAHNDYLRYGSDWSELESNIKWLSALGNHRWIPMNINHTLQMTSCWSLPPLVDWCVENRYDFCINILTWPEYLSLECMTDRQRLRLIADLEARLPAVQAAFGDGNSLKWMQGAIEQLHTVKHDTDRRARFISYVAMLDSIRGTDFHKTFGSIDGTP